MTDISEKKKILLVEDDPALRRILVEKLSDESFAVIEASDGIAGLDIAMRERPDLVLLDIFMPKMDGVTMLSHLREDSTWGKTASVLVLTNSTDAETIAKVTGLGAADFLIKSEWSLVELVERIRKELVAKIGKKVDEAAWTNPAIG